MTHIDDLVRTAVFSVDANEKAESEEPEDDP